LNDAKSTIKRTRPLLEMIEQFRRLPTWLRLSLYFPLAFINGWLLFLLIGYLEPLISVLVTSALLAFLLDFPIGFLEKKGLGRALSIFIVLFLSLISIFILSTTVFPLLINQLNDLINTIPHWLHSGTQHVEDLKKWAITQKYSNEIKELFLQIVQKLSTFVQTLSSQILNLLLGAINSLINIFLVTILTVFLVLNGQKIWDGIFSWVPRPWNSKMQVLIKQTFRTYFATQCILAGILSVAQTIALVALGVPYSLLFGICIGISMLIPFASFVTIILISILVSLNSLILGIKVLLVTLIVGQINDQIISPRLMGNMTGLNPVWLIVALFLGGKFGGVLGLIIAVPLASIFKNTVEEIRNSNNNNYLSN
jgi:predicted PurR-regulated permease PerM